MTTPQDPTTSASDTGWPSETQPSAPPPPPVEEEPAPVAEEPAPVVAEPAPVVDDRAPALEEPASVVAEPAPAVQEPAPVVEESTGVEPAAAGPGSPLRSGPVLALLLTTVLMAVAAGFVWFQVHRHDATETARRAGLEASRDAARVLFSYDYRTLAKDFSAGKAVTTGKFRAQYADTTTKVVTPVATEKKAVVKAEVVNAGVVRASTDEVVTIVFVNQVTTSSLQAGPKVDLSRVRMTLRHVGGRWLVATVDAL